MVEMFYNHDGNSLFGVGVLIGKYTKKILDSKICEIVKKKRVLSKIHDCTTL